MSDELSAARLRELIADRDGDAVADYMMVHLQAIAQAMEEREALLVALELIANTPKDATRVPQEITRNRRIARAAINAAINAARKEGT